MLQQVANTLQPVLVKVNGAGAGAGMNLSLARNRYRCFNRSRCTMYRPAQMTGIAPVMIQISGICPNNKNPNTAAQGNAVYLKGAMTTASPQDIQLMVSAAFSRLKDTNHLPLKITTGTDINWYDFPSGGGTVPKSAYIIDMNKTNLRNMWSNHKNDILAKPTLVWANEPIGTYDITRAFDRNVRADSFWEFTPLTIAQIEFNSTALTPINSYMLFGGEDSSRMPMEWKLNATNNGTDWVTLDHRKDKTPWISQEKRLYKFSSSVNYKIYRFKFIKGFDPTTYRIYEIKLLRD